MKTPTTESKKTDSSNKNNFQTNPEKKSFFKSKESSNSFFSPLEADQGVVQRKHNENLQASLQTDMENAFGHDFSNVAIQKDSQEATSLNALAFTQGENVHFAPGQFDQHTEKGKNLIGHEFVHIVQQRNGLVNPTRVLGKGLSLNDDKALESEADQLGARAVTGEPIPKYRSASLDIRNSLRTIQAKSNVIQRSIPTSGGTFDFDKYETRQDKGPHGDPIPAAQGARGVDMKLKFAPNATVDADKIGLTQTAQTVVGTTHPFIDSDPNRQKRAIATGTEKGTMIDRADARNNPIYGSPSSAAGDGLDKTPMDNNGSGHAISIGAGPHDNATYQLGFRHKVGTAWPQQDAILYDGPTSFGAQKDSSQLFETTALAIKGTQAGTYYGSVRWGWRTDSAGAFTKEPFAVASQGVPSATFMKAAGIWNAAKDSTGADTVDLPGVTP